MASHISITLDTTAPAGPVASINAGATKTSLRDVSVGITTSDGSTAGYQVKIYGDVDPAANANIQTTEGASSWITLATPHSVRLATGDGVKTVRVKMRDDVWNETSEFTDAITLDTTVPAVTVEPPTADRVSKISGKRLTSFDWSTDGDFEEYEVRVVPTTGSDHTQGTAVPTTNGSTNVAGAAGGYPSATTITTTIDGRDLDLASSGDGTKIVKVFVKDDTGNWSSV